MSAVLDHRLFSAVVMEGSQITSLNSPPGKHERRGQRYGGKNGPQDLRGIAYGCLFGVRGASRPEGRSQDGDLGDHAGKRGDPEDRLSQRLIHS